MKKILLLFLLCLSITGIQAQTASWDQLATSYAKDLNDNAGVVEETFQSMGINAKMTACYDSADKAIVMDLRFDPMVWGFFNDAAMKAAKDETLAQYRASYKGDAEFAEVIDQMKANGAKFLIKYTCEENGKIKAKEFKLNPEDIIN